jgi:hypothetical protein
MTDVSPLPTNPGEPRSSRQSRVTLFLDGEWRVAESVAADAPPAVFPHTAPVPGLVNLAQPPFPAVDEFESYELNDTRISRKQIRESARITAPGRSQQPRDYFWYRTTFRAPPGKSAAWLTINKAQFGTAVWLNGRALGEHAGCFTASRFRLTGAIDWQGENVLLVRIGAHPAVLPADFPTGSDFEKFRWTPGIYDRVSVAFCDNPVVVSVQVAPQIAPPAIVIQTKIANHDAVPRAVALTQRVTEWRSGVAFGKAGPEAVLLQPEEEKTICQTLALPGARLWSPDDPFLYVVETATGGDAVRTRFGVREFRSDTKTGCFYLNGQPCYLRGSNIALHRFFEDPACGALPWTETWVQKLLAEIPRQLHWNAFRFTIGPVPDRWLEIADECGLLIQNEFFMWTGHPRWRPKYARSWNAAELVRQYSDWMRDCWNHPSVVIWDTCNETFDPVFGGSVIPAVRGLDLSNRPWENGYNAPAGPDDPAEIHPYFHASSYWENRLQFDFAELETKTFDQVVALGSAELNHGENPLIINEYGWLWVNRDGTPTALTDRVYDLVLGPQATAAERFAFYAYAIAAETEFFRASRRYAGILHFVYLTCSLPGGFTSDPFRDVRTLELEPAFADYAAEAFKPLGLYLNFFQPKLPAGSVNTFKLVLVNDETQRVAGRVVLSFETEKGGISCSSECDFHLEAFGRTTLEVSLKAPDAAGPHLLKAAAHGNAAISGEPTRCRRKVELTR